jgi:hypothetical protein
MRRFWRRKEMCLLQRVIESGSFSEGGMFALILYHSHSIL